MNGFNSSRTGLTHQEPADYHCHILRLPIFVRKAVEKMKTFFLKEHRFFMTFSNFSNFKFFDFVHILHIF